MSDTTAQVAQPTPGPWLVEETSIYAFGDRVYRRRRDNKQPRMWAWVAGAIDTPKEELLASARVMGASMEMLALLKRYEAWEARLIACDEAWFSGAPMDDPLYNEMIELQGLRNAAIKKATIGDE